MPISSTSLFNSIIAANPFKLKYYCSLSSKKHSLIILITFIIKCTGVSLSKPFTSSLLTVFLVSNIRRSLAFFSMYLPSSPNIGSLIVKISRHSMREYSQCFSRDHFAKKIVSDILPSSSKLCRITIN